MNPITINTGANDMMLKAMSWDVNVLPTFDPMTIPSAPGKVTSPAFTKPTNVTVIAVFDWKIALTMNPVNVDFAGVSVVFER